MGRTAVASTDVVQTSKLAKNRPYLDRFRDTHELMEIDVYWVAIREGSMKSLPPESILEACRYRHFR